MFASRSHVGYEFINTKKLVKKLAKIEANSICRQQFANVFANFSLPCEGRLIDFFKITMSSARSRRRISKIIPAGKLFGLI